MKKNQLEISQFKSITFLLLLYTLYCFPLFSQGKGEQHNNLLKQRASNYYKLNDYLNAKKCFDTLLIKDKLNGEYYFKRGYCKVMLFDDLGAIVDYKKAIKNNYKFKKSAYLNIGTLLFDKGRCSEAVKFFNMCLKIDPQNTKALELKAKCLSTKKPKNKSLII